MSITQDADLIINGAGLAALLWLTTATVVRWIRRRRVESYSMDDLLPKWLPSWTRWPLFVLTVVITPGSSASEVKVDGPGRYGITPIGWLFFGCLAAWLLSKTI